MPHHPYQQLPSAVGRHLELQTPKWCPQQAARQRVADGRPQPPNVGCRGLSGLPSPCLARRGLWPRTPASLHTTVRFPTRSPFSTLDREQAARKWPKASYRRPHRQMRWSRAKKGKGNVGEGPGRENKLSQHGPSCWAEVRQDGHCAMVAFHATGSLVAILPSGHSACGVLVLLTRGAAHRQELPHGRVTRILKILHMYCQNWHRGFQQTDQPSGARN